MSTDSNEHTWVITTYFYWPMLRLHMYVYVYEALWNLITAGYANNLVLMQGHVAAGI